MVNPTLLSLVFLFFTAEIAKCVQAKIVRFTDSEKLESVVVNMGGKDRIVEGSCDRKADPDTVQLYSNCMHGPPPNTRDGPRMGRRFLLPKIAA